MIYSSSKSSSAGAVVGGVLACMLCACGGKTPASNPPVPTTVVAAETPPASWNGRWTGPEGTFLVIEGDPAGYQITIRNLDGPRTFPGSAAGRQIQFERDGVKEVIRATSGADTGMKWLADKMDCLTVRTGEGYCRD